MFSPSRHGADDGQTQIIVFLVHGKWLLLVRSAYTRPFGRNRGSSVFLMVPEHHLEVHKGRAGCFLFCNIGLGICTSSVLQCGCAPLQYQFSTPRPQTPCVKTQFNIMINMSRFILPSSLVFL